MRWEPFRWKAVGRKVIGRKAAGWKIVGGRRKTQIGEMRDMAGWTQSELLLYGGIAVMGAACVLGAVGILVFKITGKRLKRRLEQEYGKPQC